MRQVYTPSAAEVKGAPPLNNPTCLILWSEENTELGRLIICSPLGLNQFPMPFSSRELTQSSPAPDMFPGWRIVLLGMTVLQLVLSRQSLTSAWVWMIANQIRFVTTAK